MQNPLAQLSPFDINVLGKEERRKYSRAPIKFSLFYSTPRSHPEIVNRWITALPERKIDPLHDEIMDFAALFEGGLSQRFVDRFGQVQARMDDIGPWPASSGPPVCSSFYTS